MNAKNSITGKLRAKIPEIDYRFLVAAAIILIIILLGTALYIDSKAQERPREYGIGSELPSDTIRKALGRTIYYPGKKESINTEPKLVVLAFWLTTCRFTKESILNMDAVQGQFKGKALILPVTSEGPEQLEKAFARSPQLATVSLPILAEDTVLNSMFPSLSKPHLVWLWQNKVIAITGAEYLKPENVRYVLAGNKPNWPVKIDTKDFDYKKHLLDPAYPATATAYYSHLGPFLAGVQPGYGVEVDSLQGIIRTYVVNFPAYKMYLMALSRFLGIPATQVIWEVKDKRRFVYDESVGYHDQWNSKNSFCYESILPVDIPQAERLQMMREDLNHFLGLNGRLEIRKVKALVVVKTEEAYPQSAGGKTVNTLASNDATKQMRNARLSGLAWEMNQHAENPPVFTDARLKAPVDMDIAASLTDIPAIRKALQGYGLDLVEQERDVQFFVLSERDYLTTKPYSK